MAFWRQQPLNLYILYLSLEQTHTVQNALLYFIQTFRPFCHEGVTSPVQSSNTEAVSSPMTHSEFQVPSADGELK